MTPLAAGTCLNGGPGDAPRYKIIRVLAVGGFSITYLAEDQRLGGEVALKELACDAVAHRAGDGLTVVPSKSGLAAHQKLVANTLKEARTLNSIRHAHIVRVLDVFRENGTAYYAMDVVRDALPLGQVPLSRERTPEIGRRVEHLALSVLSALEAVHAGGLIHGDIKPDNVLVDPHDRVTLIDFGTVRAPDAAPQPGIGRIYTRGYAAPELTPAGEGLEVGPWSDLYAWGMLLWGMVLGHQLHTPIAADERGASDPYRNAAATLRAAGVPSRWSAVIAWCIELDPEQRPQSATQVIEALAGTSLYGSDERETAARTFASELNLLTEERDHHPAPGAEGTHASPTARSETVAEPSVNAATQRSKTRSHTAFRESVVITPRSLKECPGCAVLNRPQARYCYTCGVPLPTESPSNVAGAPATLFRRVVAGTLDMVLIVGFSVAVYALVATYTEFDPTTLDRSHARLGVACGLIGTWTMVVSASIAWRGRTAGMRTLGIRVVDGDGRQPGFLRSLARALATLVCSLGGFIGILWIAVSMKRMGWHDHLSGTRVVRVSSPGSETDS